MQKVQTSHIKEAIIDILVARGSICSDERAAYSEIGSLVYHWKQDNYHFGIRVPLDRRNEDALMRYVNRFARTIGIGGGPYRTVYLTARESRILHAELELEWPKLFAQLKKAYPNIS